MTIICGTDFSGAAGIAFAAASELCCAFSDTLHIVHALEVESPPGDTRSALRDNVATAKLAELVERARSRGLSVTTAVSPGPAEALIAREGDDADARLIVVGREHRKAPWRTLLGSVPDEVVSLARRPVMVVPDATTLSEWLCGGVTALRVLVAIEDAVDVDAILTGFAPWMRLAPCEVFLTHIVQKSMPQQPQLDVQTARAFGDSIYARTVPWRGAPWRGLLAAATQQRAGLVVVGTFLPRRHLRSMTTRILHASPVPVLSIPLTRIRANA